jgi:NOL1/NOP2/fmu family ribosome biogenesis protein
MAFIAHKEKNFQRFIEKHFGIRLPEGACLFYAEGVRAGNDEIRKSGIRGETGYAACDAGFMPTNSFMQNFGHLATKNFIEVDEPRAKEFAVGRGLGNITMEGKGGPVIVRHAGFCVGLGMYEAKERKIRNLIPEKRRRKIINSLEAIS